MYAIGFLLGCWIVMFFSELPSLGVLCVVVGGCFYLAFYCRDLTVELPWMGQCRWVHLPLMIGCCFLGVLWQGWHCRGLLRQQLSLEQEGKHLSVLGTISDLPRCDKANCSFTFQIQELEGRVNPMSVRLSWYGVNRRLHVGERWRLTVRLKRPIGTLNPGGFDFEGWCWQRHISAKGNVNNSRQNQYEGISKGYSVSRWREKLLKACRDLLEGEALGGVVMALNLGWTQAITHEQREVVQRTGTAHLLAISGLHVGMVAGLIGLLLRWMWSFIPVVTRSVPAPTMGAFGAMLAAVVYSEMAGFACSTQRACVMCALLVLPKIVHRHMTVKTALFRAVWVVLFWDPCVVQSSGFWLSFMAVFVLVYARYTQNVSRWVQHLEGQWVCLIGLLPLSCWYFHQVSLVSVLANLIAIPVVGFVVLPLVLLGSALAIPQVFLAKILFCCALKILTVLGFGLACLSQKNWAIWSYSFSHSWEFLVVCSGCALVVFTRKKWRWVGLMGVSPLILPNISVLSTGEFKLTVLDVGQGLATVISTRHHTLIYDTGAQFSPQLDCGQQIVIPYLILEKIKKIDTLVVSHGDNDHAGGAMAILKQWPVEKLYTSDPDRFTKRERNQAEFSFTTEALQSKITPPTECVAGTQWEWDGVKFEFLHPPPDPLFKANNQSCVLKVSSQHGAVLFPGDIEKSAEQWLVENSPQKLASSILIVPHHGSKTSSTLSFIEAIHPQLAILSYGYLNRYHHPDSLVIERYHNAQIVTLNTVNSGAISCIVGSKGFWSQYRAQHQEFWRSSPE